MTTTNYLELKPAMIVATAEKLSRRIAERFPEAGLARLAAEIHGVAQETVRRIQVIRRPRWSLRILAALVLLGVPLAVILAEQQIVGERVGRLSGLADFVQTLEASLGSIVFLGAAVFFFFSLEARSRRSRTLAALSELRSLAHIIDMHQLSKGPERLGGASRTASSPQVALTPYQMERYLDYCSELLSLLGKVAALYVQGLHDPLAVTAVDELEDLTTGLSRKIWQKITLVRRQASALPR